MNVTLYNWLSNNFLLNSREQKKEQKKRGFDQILLFCPAISYKLYKTILNNNNILNENVVISIHLQYLYKCIH